MISIHICINFVILVCSNFVKSHPRNTKEIAGAEGKFGVYIVTEPSNFVTSRKTTLCTFP